MKKKFAEDRDRTIKGPSLIHVVKLEVSDNFV